MRGDYMNQNEDLSENLNYNTPELPVLTSEERLSELPAYRELMHWHNDFEFVLVTDGIMDFDINGEIVHIKSGQGIFVNSGRLHYGFSEARKEVIFKLIIISSEIIRNSFNEQTFESISSRNNVNYFLFHKNMLIWSMLEQIYNINKKHDFNYILELQSEFCLLVKELSLLCTDKNKNDSEEMAIMKQMLYFIQRNFSEKISVSDIASSAMVCRNKCFRLFQKIMQMTPQQYLMQYRVNQSIEMMKNQICMADIAQSCGFSSQSHYIKVFRNLYGVTPKQYIKNII